MQEIVEIIVQKFKHVLIVLPSLLPVCGGLGVYPCTLGVKRGQVVEYLASLIMSSAPGAMLCVSKWSVVAIILEFQAQPNDLRQPIAPATDTLVNPSQVPNIYGSNVGQLTKLISPMSTVKEMLN